MQSKSKGCKWPGILSVKDVAKKTGFGVGAIYDAIHAGDLEAIRPRHYKKGYFIREESLEEWLNNLFIRIN